MFQTSAGIATTNNCIESFNKQVKNVYTGYEIVTVYHFLLIVMQKIINQHSYQPKQFCLYRSTDFDMITKANEIVDTGIPFLQIENNNYWFNNKYKLSIEDNITYVGYKFVCCNCISYNESFVCKHAIALAITFNLKLKGFELKTSLSSNNKRGRQPKAKPALVREGEFDGRPPLAPRTKTNCRPYLKKN